MDLHILGGGGFFGYHLAAEAYASGNRVTTFSCDGSRDISGVEALKGDRNDDLSVLAGRR